MRKISLILFFTIVFISCKIETKNNTDVDVLYNVSYVNEKGDAPESIKVKYGTILSEKQLPELNNPEYLFEGWYDYNSVKACAGKYDITKDITLTAKWKEIIQNNHIYLYSGEGWFLDGSVELIKEYKKGTNITLPNPEEIGLSCPNKVFSNWQVFDQNLREYIDWTNSYSFIISEDIKFRAAWKTITNEEDNTNLDELTDDNITDPDSSENDISNITTDDTNQNNDLPENDNNITPIDISEENDNTPIIQLSLSNANIHNIVGQEILINVCFEKFVMNPTNLIVYITNGSNILTQSVSIVNEKEFYLSTKGFNKGSYQVFSKYNEIESNKLSLELEKQSYTITFHPNKGSITTPQRVFEKDTGNTLIDTIPSISSLELYRSGYVFKGWTNIEGSKSIIYTDGAEISMVSDIDLYAVWGLAGTPTELIINKGEFTNYFNIQFNPVVNATKYQVFCSLSDDHSLLEEPITTIVSTTETILLPYDIVEPNNKHVYYFFVKALDDDNNTSEISNYYSYNCARYYTKPQFNWKYMHVGTNMRYAILGWRNSSNKSFWIYWNTENDVSKAQCLDRIVLSTFQDSAYYSDPDFCYTYNITSFFNTLVSQGKQTIYFWIKAADTDSEESMTSEFTDPISYTFSNISFAAEKKSIF